MRQSLAELVQHFSDVGSLTKASPDELQSLCSEYADIPPDYVQFLESAGHGNLGSISLYSSPVKAGEVYPDVGGRLAEILLIGDDFQGYSFGFEPNDNWRIVEVGLGGEIDTSIESDFLSLLTGYMKADLEND